MKQPVNVTNWWQAVDRRTFGKGVVAFTALLSMSGCGSEEELNGDTLTLQQQHGWNVGAKDRRLVFSGKPMQRERRRLRRLAGLHRPESADLRLATAPSCLAALLRAHSHAGPSGRIPALADAPDHEPTHAGSLPARPDAATGLAKPGHQRLGDLLHRRLAGSGGGGLRRRHGQRRGRPDSLRQLAASARRRAQP